MIPTQRQIDLMDPKDRAQFPAKIRATTAERAQKDERKRELEMHNEFSSYLQLRNRIFQAVHANPAKPSTIRKGWPDYTILCKTMTLAGSRPIACLIEFKIPGGHLSADQVKCFGELELAGIPVYVCTSVGDAIEQLIDYFKIPREALQ